MPNDNVSARALCPFFKGAEKKEIRCEGAVDEAATLLVFVSGERRGAHVERYCCGRYSECAAFRAVIREKYGGGVPPG